MNDDILELLRNALLSPRDENLLSKVREHAAELQDALEEGELEWAEEDARSLEKENEWVAQVYQALADSEAAAEEEDDDLTRTIEQMHADRDREIAFTFVTTLDALPGSFHQWDHWFADVPEAPEKYQRFIREQLIVVKGGAHAAMLVPYGMTPGTFAEAARGVELLVNHVIRTARQPPEQHPDITPELVRLYEYIRQHTESGDLPSVILTLHEPFEGCVPRELLLSQIRGTPGCPPEAAEPLTHWMIGVAQLKPFFFAGYRAKTRGEGEIQLTESRSDR